MEENLSGKLNVCVWGRGVIVLGGKALDIPLNVLFLGGRRVGFS
jgi:hypothetical protein